MSTPTYPVPTQAQYDAINAAAQKAGISTALSLGLAAQESGFTQSDVSSAGAIGDYQLMPATAGGLGVNPYNEAQNITGGNTYIRQMLDAFGGDQTAALTAYNAGIGNVKTLGVAGAQALPGADPNYSASVQAAEAYYAKAYNLTPQANYSGSQAASGGALGALSSYGGALFKGATTAAGVLNPVTSAATIASTLNANTTPGGTWSGPFGLSINVSAFNKNFLTIAIILLLVGGGLYLMAPKQEMADAAELAAA